MIFFLFGFIADVLTTILSILLPIFASYKALQARDPAMLSKWLTYWITLSLVLLVESQLYFVLSWFPFYPWIRLVAHLYLMAPGQQGAVMIYEEYIGPFIYEHERGMEEAIDGVWGMITGHAAEYLKRA